MPEELLDRRPGLSSIMPASHQTNGSMSLIVRSMILSLACLMCVPAVAEDARRPLFNGKDMEGWQHVGPGSFLIEDGLLKTEGGMGLLWYTREKFGNVILRVAYKTS